MRNEEQSVPQSVAKPPVFERPRFADYGAPIIPSSSQNSSSRKPHDSQEDKLMYNSYSANAAAANKGDSSLNILVKVISIITTVTTEITLLQGATTTLKIIADHHQLQSSTWRMRIINNSNSSSLLRMKLNKDPRLQGTSQQPLATRNNNITSSRSIQLKTKIPDTQ